MPEQQPEVGIWLRPERSGRGPAPGFDRDRLAEAGVELADAQGLAAVTMRAVARSLGSAPASLYRYVATRDELIELMVDRANGEISYDGLDAAVAASVAAPGDPAWLGELLLLARQARGVLLRHPWLLDVFAGSAPIGPRSLDFLDRCLGALVELPLSGREKLEGISVLLALVNSLVRAELAKQDDADEPPAWRRAQQQYLAHAATTGEHPHLAAAFIDARPSKGTATAEELFDRIVTRALRGLLT